MAVDNTLYRSSTNKVVAGVCGGLGEHLGLDPVLLRIITIVLVFTGGVGVIAYLIAWIVIPKRPFDAVEPGTPREMSKWNKYLPGLAFIAIGAILLMRTYIDYFDWDAFWPILVILTGLFLILVKGRKRDANSPEDVNPQNPNSENGGNTL